MDLMIKHLNDFIDKSESAKLDVMDKHLISLKEKFEKESIYHNFVQSFIHMSERRIYQFFHESTMLRPISEAFSITEIPLTDHDITRKAREDLDQSIQSKLDTFTLEHFPNYFDEFYNTILYARTKERIRLVTKGGFKHIVKDEEVAESFRAFKNILSYFIKISLGLEKFNPSKTMELILPIALHKGIKHNRNIYYVLSKTNIYKLIRGEQEAKQLMKVIKRWYQDNQLDFLQHFDEDEVDLYMIYECSYMLNEEQNDYMINYFEKILYENYMMMKDDFKKSLSEYSLLDTLKLNRAKKLKEKLDTLKEWKETR